MSPLRRLRRIPAGGEKKKISSAKIKPRENKAFRNHRVLVTGAGGFIGRGLAAELLRRGAKVYGLQRTPARLPGVCEFVGDVANAAFIRSTLQRVKPDIIYHLAGNRSRDTHASAGLIRTNILGCRRLLNSARRQNPPPRVVVVGTIDEYGRAPAPYIEGTTERPVSAYGKSKLIASRTAIAFSRGGGPPCTVLRPSLVYGPGQGADMFLPALIVSLLRGRPFKMTHGRQVRDFVYIDDMVSALLKAAVTPEATGEIINIGSGRSVSIRHAARLVGRLTRRSALLRLGAISRRTNEPPDYRLSVRKAARVLGWKGRISLAVGLARTIASYRRNP